MLIHVIQYFNIVNRLEYFSFTRNKKDIFEILINYKKSYNLFKCSYHGTETSCGLYHFLYNFCHILFNFFEFSAKPLIHFQKYIVYVFICVSQNKQEYVKLPLSIFFAILYKIFLRKQYRMKFILYLRRVNTKIAKVHLENLKNHFNSTKVCRLACVFSIVCLTLSQIWTRKKK